MFQDGKGPAVPDGSVGVPFAQVLVLYLVEEGDVMAPANSCRHCLHKFSWSGPCLREGAHVVQISAEKPVCGNSLRKSSASRPSTLLPQGSSLLPLQNSAADLPVKLDHGRVDHSLGTQLSGSDKSLQGLGGVTA